MIMTELIKSLQSVLMFDGLLTHISLGQKPEFQIEKEITLEAWIYCEAQRRRPGIITNVFDTSKVESGYGLLLDGKSGIFFALKTTSKTIQYLSSKEDSVKLNQWHHIAGTYDGQRMKVYVDGVEKNTKVISNSSINYHPENDLLIGMYKDNNESYPFSGQIADIRIWKVARTEQELRQNMHHRLQGSELGLVGYWSLNEGSSHTVCDKTSFGNNGIIHNANWVQTELPIVNVKYNFKLGVDPIMVKETKTPPQSIEIKENKASEAVKKTEEIKQDCMMTGLSDYGFWAQKVKEEREARKEPDPSFRRGRIWC